MKHSKEKIQVVKELHMYARKKFPRRRIIIRGLDDLWQSDLGQMETYARENKNFKYVLVVIECFSKFVWAEPLKQKSATEVTKAFSSILKKAGRVPSNLQTDQGKEFFNSQFRKLMIENNINHYNTYTKTKAAIVERVMRTLKEKLYRYFSLNGTYKWIDILQTIVDEYNGTKHSKINMAPRNVSKMNEKSILNSSYNNIKIAGKNKLYVGDMVRISKAKHIFSKGFTPNWTTELFKIVKVQITQPVTYLLEDTQGRPIRGAFYEQELKKTCHPDVYLVERILRRKKDKILVRWLGLDSTHDSWIDNTNRL